MGLGLHELAYSLTLDPAEEIRGAVSDAAGKSWQELQSLDAIVAEASDGLEAEVRDAPVYAHGSGAEYHSDAVELPVNYQDSGYKTPQDDDDDAEVDYAAFPDAAWAETRKEYEQEVEKRIEANILKSDFMPIYTSVEMGERVKNYGISIGSLSFVLYDIKQLNK